MSIDWSGHDGVCIIIVVLVTYALILANSIYTNLITLLSVSGFKYTYISNRQA